MNTRKRDVRQLRRAAQERDHADPYAIDEEADEHAAFEEFARQGPSDLTMYEDGHAYVSPVTAFARRSFAAGVAWERERAAKVCDEHAAMIGALLAELIRKGAA